MPESIRITSDNYVKFAATWLSRGYYIDVPLAEQRLHGANAYTARQDAQVLRAEIQLRTAYWLRENFPGLRYFTGGLAADAVFALRSTDDAASSERQRLVSEYMNRSSMLERLLLQLRLGKRRLVSGWA